VFFALAIAALPVLFSPAGEATAGIKWLRAGEVLALVCDSNTNSTNDSDRIAFCKHNTTELMRLQETGNLGIGGSSAPAYRVTVTTATSNYGLVHTDGTVEVATYAAGASGGRVGTKNSYPFSLMTAGTQRLNITATGSIGIGVLTAASMLDVAGGVTVGGTYAGTNAAPSNGLLVEGNVLIGRTTPRQAWVDMVDVQGGPLVVTDGSVDNILSTNAGGIVGTRTNHALRLVTNDTPRMYIASTGNVEVGGTGSADEKLHVRGNIKANGKIIADSVRVQRVIVNNWVLDAPPDYVFDQNYNLRSLGELERYVKANKHLPGVPSAAEIQRNGLDLTEMNMTLLMKVEELTLHSIAQEKRIKSLETRLQHLAQ
jgi:hypothetical protein